MRLAVHFSPSRPAGLELAPDGEITDEPRPSEGREFPATLPERRFRDGALSAIPVVWSGGWKPKPFGAASIPRRPEYHTFLCQGGQEMARSIREHRARRGASSCSGRRTCGTPSGQGTYRELSPAHQRCIPPAERRDRSPMSPTVGLEDLPPSLAHGPGVLTTGSRAQRPAIASCASSGKGSVTRYSVAEASLAAAYSRRTRHEDPLHVGCVAVLSADQVRGPGGRPGPISTVFGFMDAGLGVVSVGADAIRD